MTRSSSSLPTSARWLLRKDRGWRSRARTRGWGRKAGLSLQLLVIFWFVIPLGAEAVSDDRRLELHIEQQSLDSALLQFSEQSHIQVFYATELVADYDAPEVSGSFTVEEAISLVLSSSPLDFRYNSKDTIVVTKSREESQIQQPEAEDQLPYTLSETVLVTGLRYTIRNSIEEKRNSDQIIEALTTDDIGNLPALSIGEALETLTGVAAHREQGGATEVSIRGLGPFLGSTTVNRREASNGSGDRSVNFSQFPAELFSAIKVYKTQQARLIEGGVAGQIELETARPLDRKEKRVLVELKGAYNPDNGNIHIAEREIGSRATFSYLDQFDTSGGGRFGIALGLQSNRTTNPEAEARSSGVYRDCRNDPSVEVGVYSSENCDSGKGDLELEVDPNTGIAPDAGAPFILVPSQRSYRQNITDDERDAVFAAFQWQPNEKTDIYFDAQYSDRTFTEIRNDLVFAEQRRVNPEGLISTSDGAVQSFENDGRIETHSAYQERLEEYTGVGLGIDYDYSDRLRLSVDAAYSETSRREHILQTRLQSAPFDIFGDPTPAGTDRPEAAYDVSGGGADIFTVALTDFDVTNADLFATNARTRIDLNQARDNSILSLRGDFELVTDWGAINRFLGGVRASRLEFTSFPRIRDERSFSDSAIRAVNLACRNGAFPESDFLSGPRNGQDLVTRVDEGGNVIAQGTGNTYASFDPLCLADMFIGESWAFPEPGPTTGNVDVEESSLAGYLQANYAGELWGRPVRGNFGLRTVHTDVSSVGLRTTFSTARNPDGTLRVIEDAGNFQAVVGGGSYVELLPSLSAVLDLTPETILRFGVFRGLSRPGPADLGFGRQLIVDDSADPTSLEDLAGSSPGALGNPELKPLTSWNLDLALEWYPDPDTTLAVGGYYKRFLGGYESVQRTEEFQIDGQPFFVDVTTSRTATEASNLYGLELTATHSLSYLSSRFWSGFGVKVGYNYASSDFEFRDQNFGESQVLDEAGNVVSRRVGIVPPADIFGLSEHVFSAQTYYEAKRFHSALIYKYRSSYFQQFINTPGLIRYIGDTEVVELKTSYQIHRGFSVHLDGINLFDEPRKQYIPITGNLAELNAYGPRFFVGLRYRS